jgi:hypothetical protein
MTTKTRMSRRHLIRTAVVLTALVPTARAQTSYPMLSRVEPTALQRGTTAEVTISGTGNFAGAWQILCEAPGLSGEVSGEAGPGQGTRPAKPSIKARLSVAADAPLGPREIRVATPQGSSSVGLVVVVNSPVAAEADDKANDQIAGAQVLSIPVTATGSIGKSEDVDWYAFEAAAGQRVTIRAWGNRLENKIHDLQMHFDPILLLHDGNGRELAADDNHDFADPMLSYECKEAGRYLLQIRDTTYAGNANWTYVLEVTSGPYATSVFPLAVNPGATATLRAEGANFDPEQTIVVDVPDGTPRGPWLTSLATKQGPTLAVPLVVTALPVVREESDAPAEPAQAQPLAIPAAMSGRLGAGGDIDEYRIEAKKGQIYAFEVIARRAGAATDPVLRILNDKGGTLAEADDTFGKDPRLEWTAPADGPFVVQVADLHSRGGAEFGYVLEAEAARPDFVLTCDPDKLNVGPDGRVPVFVQVTRRNGFSGPVRLDWDGLPEGVTASPLVIGASMTQGVMIISAAHEVMPAAALVSLRGKAETADGPIVRSASPKQEIYMPGGGRGVYGVNTLALTVTDPSDITVEAKPETITLTPGGSATIDVTVTRRKDFDKGVNLAVILSHLGGVHGNPLPPGVTVADSGNKTLLGPTETAGKIVLRAAANAAPCEDVPIVVMGHVSINFVVKTAYASKPIAVSVVPKDRDRSSATDQAKSSK